jgi:hypothetical protein
VKEVFARRHSLDANSQYLVHATHRQSLAKR